MREDVDESTGGPAFSFDETDMHGFYVREDIVGWRHPDAITQRCRLLNV